MNRRLVILSDLWGFGKTDWLDLYINQLRPYFDLVYYDCRELGAVDMLDDSEAVIHAQFVNGGIARAVEALREREQKVVSILAFSIGGTIAWKAGLSGLQMESLYTISATRLRYETSKPRIESLELYFGEEDAYRPQKEWFEKMYIVPHLIKGQGHEIYMDSDFINEICFELKVKLDI